MFAVPAPEIQTNISMTPFDKFDGIAPRRNIDRAAAPVILGPGVR